MFDNPKRQSCGLHKEAFNLLQHFLQTVMCGCRLITVVQAFIFLPLHFFFCLMCVLIITVRHVKQHINTSQESIFVF